MERITVSFRKHNYPITIASGLFYDSSFFSPLKKGDRAMLVTNETVAALYIDQVRFLLEQAGVRLDTIILPDGEEHKNLSILDLIFTALLQKKHGRDTTLIALGGGVIGDLTGFAAASYQRGVRFIQVPTTLLSQVDSSLGGKTSVNHSLGKNMIGAFWHPSSVIANLDCLKMLPPREVASGFAEVIKYGIVLDAIFFNWLEENIDVLLSLDEKTISYCIRRCCELKAKIIAIDEKESGFRSLLNFGHTYGHAIETEMGYGNWLHGEAVSVGMVIAARTSERIGLFKKEKTNRIISLLRRVGLPVYAPRGVSAQKYLPHIMRDKKVLGSKIRLILPLEIGKSIIYEEVSHEIIFDAITDCQEIQQ